MAKLDFSNLKLNLLQTLKVKQNYIDALVDYLNNDMSSSLGVIAPD